MSGAIIDAGICGFKTEVMVRKQGRRCALEIRSDCEDIQEMAKQLREVDPYEEISFRGEGPLTFRIFRKCCRHPACPVPAGIIKAVEVEAGLALARDVSIEVFNDKD